MKKTLISIILALIASIHCSVQATGDPLVSVIIPVYNVEEYLKECLDSVINQTYKNLEIILINDGATDSSPKICEKYQQKDKRIVLISQKNKGLGAARNAGMDIAKGEYITFVDSDDFIDERMVELLLEACLKNKLSLAISDFYIYIPPNLQQNRQMKLIERRSTYSFAGEKFPNWPTAWGKLYHRSIVKDLRFPNIFHEDVGFWYGVLSKCNRNAIVDKSLYYYRQNESGITKNEKNIPQRCCDQIKSYEHGLNLIEKDSDSARKIKLINILVLNYFRISYEQEYMRDAVFREKEYAFLYKLKKYKNVLVEAARIKLMVYLLCNKIPYLNRYLVGKYHDKVILFIAWILEPFML